jgi:multiple sugar transport system substrate-binding protein
VIRACAVAALLIAGCARGPEPAQLQVFGDPAELGAYRELIATYESRNPGRKIELIPVGSQKDHMTKLATAFAAGAPPELFIVNFRRFGQFAGKGVLEPLGPALAATGGFDPDDFYAPALEAFQVDGAQVCVPQNVSSLVVYYNRKVFETYKVPLPGADWSLNKFIAAAMRLTRDTDGDHKRDLYGLGIDPTLIRLAPFVWLFGGELVDNVQRPTRIALLEGRARQALGMIKSLAPSAVPPHEEHKAIDEEARFAQGKLAMLLHSRRLTPTLREVKDLDWDVAPFPPSNGRQVGALHADAYCLSRKGANREAAIHFAAFALGIEGQTIVARSGRTVPSRKVVAESDAFLAPGQRPASARVFLDAIPHLRRTPNTPEWNEIETKADVLAEEWLYEHAARGEEESRDLGFDLALAIAKMADPILAEAAKKR